MIKNLVSLLEWIINSKKMHYFLVLCFLFSNSLMGSLAYVDSDKLLEKSSAYMDLMNKLDQLSLKYKQEIDPLGKEIQQRRKNLIQEKDKIAPDLFAEKAKKLQDDYEGFRARTITLKERYDNFKESGLGQIKKNVEKVSLNLIALQKYSAILDKKSIYMNGDLRDVTDELLEELNKKFPAVNLENCKNKEGVCDV